jgi:hypothetical protein
MSEPREEAGIGGYHEWMFSESAPLTGEQAEEWQKPIAKPGEHECENCPTEGEID